MGPSFGEILPDHQWDNDAVEELQAEVYEWRDLILNSDIDYAWKRNIIRALEDVLDAIANHEVRGNNHLTDAVVRLKAMLSLPAIIRLLPYSMQIGSWAMMVIEGIGGGQPALPPGDSENE